MTARHRLGGTCPEMNCNGALEWREWSRDRAKVTCVLCRFESVVGRSEVVRLYGHRGELRRARMANGDMERRKVVRTGRFGQ